MNRWICFAALACLAAPAQADTLATVTARDALICGVNPDLEGFSVRDAQDRWSGFDVAMCRALAAAVLGDASKARFVPVAQDARFAALERGEIDVLLRNAAWSFSDDAGRAVEFVGVNYYDAQGFMVPKESVTSAKELIGAKICVSGEETALADYFVANAMSYLPVPVDLNTDGAAPYLDGACTALLGELSSLAATRAGFAAPEGHVMLPEVISKEPFGPVVRDDDPAWADIIRWTLHALIAAEEFGVTSANVQEMAVSGTDPQVARLLGAQGDLGAKLGLDRAWAKRAIAASGNYGEIFATTIGEQTPLGLARGLNAQWKDGGLLYAPPFR